MDIVRESVDEGEIEEGLGAKVRAGMLAGALAAGASAYAASDHGDHRLDPKPSVQSDPEWDKAREEERAEREETFGHVWRGEPIRRVRERPPS